MGTFDRADRGLARVAECRAVPGGEELRLEHSQRPGGLDVALPSQVAIDASGNGSVK
jgi:hypothetical protein